MAITAVASCLTVPSCGDGTTTLPPVQVASAHFRVHAESPELVPTGIRGVLEANRADVVAYFGLDDGDEVIDYFLLDPSTALNQCGDNGTCARGQQVFTNLPFDRQNLIHAFFAAEGDPPRAVQEGVAQAVSCYDEAPAYGSGYATWQELFQTSNDNSPDFQVAAMRLVHQLLLQYGPQRFLDYYRKAKFTTDAAVFAGAFAQFWSVAIDDIWASANAATTLRRVPICPCRAPAIVPGPMPVYLATGSYRPLGVEQNASVTLSYSNVAAPTLLDCQREYLPLPLATSFLGPFREGLVAMTVDADPHYLMGTGPNQNLLTLTAGNGLAADCASAVPLSLGYTLEQLGFIVPRGARPTYFKLSPSAEHAGAARTDTSGGNLSMCSDCSLSDCAPVPQDSASMPIPPSGAVLEIDPSTLPGTGLAAFAMTIEFP